MKVTQILLHKARWIFLFFKVTCTVITCIYCSCHKFSPRILWGLFLHLFVNKIISLFLQFFCVDIVLLDASVTTRPHHCFQTLQQLLFSTRVLVGTCCLFGTPRCAHGGWATLLLGTARLLGASLCPPVGGHCLPRSLSPGHPRTHTRGPEILKPQLGWGGSEL